MNTPNYILACINNMGQSEFLLPYSHARYSSSRPFGTCSGSVVKVFHSSSQEICEQTRSSRESYFKQREKLQRRQQEDHFPVQSDSTEKKQRYLARHGIRWQFIVERAPWWEGLVGSVNQKVSWQDLTVLSFPDIVIAVTEVEVVLKSLPLTNWYQDVEDYPT